MIQYLRYFWEILNRRQKKIFFILILINIMNSILEIASVGALFPIIFALISPDSLNTIPAIKNFLENYAPVRGENFIVLALAVTVIAFILKNVFFGFSIWFKVYYIEKITIEISQRLYLKYITTPYESHIRRNTAEVIRNLTQSIEMFRMNFLNIFLDLITHVSIGVSYLIFLSYVDPVLMSYFVIIMSLVMLLITYKIRRVTKKLGRHLMETNKRKNYYILMGIMGFKEIKVLLREIFFIEKFSKVSQELRKIGASSTFLNQLPRLIIETVVVFLSITAMIILFVQDQSSPVIIAKLGVFGFAALKIFPMFYFFSSSLVSLAFGATNLEIIHKELIRDPIKNPSSVLNRKPLPFKKTIELKDVYFHFKTDQREERNVLDGIDLTIKKNTVVGLVGESGSGKTTLVDIIIGFMSPQQGEVLIDGKPLNRMGVWSDKIGYIPQQIYLSNASIKENIALGWDKQDIDDRRVWEVLKIAQLEEMVKSLPEGIDTEIGELGVKLSGGQRQRVGIARALYHKPEILVLDEATSALDNRTEMDFVNRLKKLDILTTQIIIAHRLTTVKHCDIIYILDKGRIVEQGNYARLERTGKYFRWMLLKDTNKKTKKSDKKVIKKTKKN